MTTTKLAKELKIKTTNIYDVISLFHYKNSLQVLRNYELDKETKIVYISRIKDKIIFADKVNYDSNYTTKKMIIRYDDKNNIQQVKQFIIELL